MVRVTLERLTTSDQGTFGRISLGGKIFFTGELPWRDNENNKSCIPVGIYQVRWTMSAHFKREMYLVEGVDDRLGIRIHSANFMGDKSLRLRCQLSGCIALGEKIAEMAGQKALIVSAPAVRNFEEILGRKPFTLEIIDGIR
jgi:hypothetical protein